MYREVASSSSSRPNWRSACCCLSAQNVLSNFVQSKNLKIKIYSTIILLVVLYGSENWYLTLTEHRLKLFRNRVLGKVFAFRGEEVTRDWRKLRVIKSRRMRLVRNVYRVLFEKPQ